METEKRLTILRERSVTKEKVTIERRDNLRRTPRPNEPSYLLSPLWCNDAKWERWCSHHCMEGPPLTSSGHSANSKFSVWNPTGLLKMISWNTSPILPVCHKRRVRARNGAFMKNVWPCVRASDTQTCSYRHAEVNGAHGAEEVRNESREQRGGLHIKHWF